MQDDTRLFSRLPYNARAVLVCLPRLCEVRLIDISEHGVLAGAMGYVGVGVGDQTRLRVLTEKGNQAFEVGAVVAHRSEQLIGLEINAIDHHAKSTLRRMIEMNLGTPNLATRSLPVLLKANFSASPAPSGGA